MKPGFPKLTVIPPDVQAPVPTVPDMFSEERMIYDLARFARSSGVLRKYVERLRSRFTKAGEKAILEHWIAFYERGRRLIEARTEMERRRSEYLQLSNEHELRAKEKEANIAEHNLRRDIAEYKRQHIERFSVSFRQGCLKRPESGFLLGQEAADGGSADLKPASDLRFTDSLPA